MERYFQKRPRNSVESQSVEQPTLVENLNELLNENVDVDVGISLENVETNEDDIVADPGLRKSIDSFNINMQDRIRREYVSKGPCQPYGHNFPKKKFGKDNKGFRDVWFKQFEWLEYSIAKDSAYCFWCFLFKNTRTAPGDDAFTKNGFSNWRRATDRFRGHVGDHDSAHNKARIDFKNFQNQKQSVTYVLSQGSKKVEDDYRIRLTATLDVTRYLLGQGLAFRGHDETETSIRKGNFLELLHWYSLRSVAVGNVILKNAPRNSQMSSPPIQKDMVNACAVETTLAILEDLGDNLFSIMVDEARDCSVKEQLAIVIRYVNKHGSIIERFVGLVHVKDTTAKCLKEGIDSLFAKYGLSISRLRDQGYDRASNMRGELNGLKAIILQENPSAWHIHCFAHQLQLVIVAVCKLNRYTCDFFNYLNMIVNTCGSSCKRVGETHQLLHERTVQRLEKGEISTRRGKNQETSLCRPGGTRWGSHFITIYRLTDMWSIVLEVLHNVFEDSTEVESAAQARGLIQKMQTYEFVFHMMLMRHILGITNSLSLALQERDQNILNAVIQITLVKDELQSLRESGWDDLLKEVDTFCRRHEIPCVNLEDTVPRLPLLKRDGQTVTYYHHFRVEIFCEVIDSIAQEMNHRFSEASTDLLGCIACLDPRNEFSNFNIEKLVHLVELYPEDFSDTERMIIHRELKTFYADMRRD